VSIETFEEKKGSYYVQEARFCCVGEEWNNNIWNPGSGFVGCHALYLRTDHTDSKAVLHMLDGDIELIPDRIYFIPALSVLYSEINGEMEKYYIHFRCDFIDFGVYRHQYEKCWVPADEMTKSLFEMILKNNKKKTPGSERKVQGAMEILLADILEHLAVKPRDVEKFEAVLRYIQAHYCEKLEIGELARMMNLSKVYFSNAFKAAFGVSPKQYIQGLRLFESQRLLTRTSLSVREIAEQVGFDNENYFSEFFSAKAGMSALKFRNSANYIKKENN